MSNRSFPYKRFHPILTELCINNHLRFACFKGHLEIVQYLIGKRADIEVKDALERTNHTFVLRCHYLIVSFSLNS